MKKHSFNPNPLAKAFVPKANPTTAPSTSSFNPPQPQQLQAPMPPTVSFAIPPVGYMPQIPMNYAVYPNQPVYAVPYAFNPQQWYYQQQQYNPAFVQMQQWQAYWDQIGATGGQFPPQPNQ
jgi:hypothetical protein